MVARFFSKLSKRIFVPFNRVHFGLPKNRNLIAIVKRRSRDIHAPCPSKVCRDWRTGWVVKGQEAE